jgi:hypothetical protein
MSGAEYEITIRQGDTFRLQLSYRSGGAPVDLTGYTAEMVISWPRWRSDTAPAVNEGEIMATMAALDSTGIIVATLDNEQTSAIPVGPPVRYQLRVRVGDDPVNTILSGMADVKPDVFEYVT